MNPKVNQDLCIACGLCVNICPDVFDWDDTGLAKAVHPEHAVHFEADVEEAIDSCPTEAISKQP